MDGWMDGFFHVTCTLGFDCQIGPHHVTCIIGGAVFLPEGQDALNKDENLNALSYLINSCVVGLKRYQMIISNDLRWE